MRTLRLLAFACAWLSLCAALTPPAAIADSRIAEWIRDLDAEDFDSRIAAERRLFAAGDQAETKLLEAVRKPASLEQKHRAQRLLGRLDLDNEPAHVRNALAVEILERIGSKEAIAVLQKLAKGAPAARLTREANESLQRITRSEEP